jgi:2,3-dihydroxybiphenyl 1,2-dioxygenase
MSIVLGYLGFEVSDLGAWEVFATDVLGLEVAERTEGGLSLRMDGHKQRFFLVEGPGDDLAFLGFELDGPEAFEATVAHLRGGGLDVLECGAQEAAARGVSGLARFEDLNGMPVEVSYGAARAAAPFKSKVVASHFVADGLGLGHVVMRARDREASVAFYEEMLGFKVSDRITTDIFGYKVDISFMHAPSRPDQASRHHSLAFGERLPKRIHHFMLEVASLDDLGMAFDRTVDHRHPVTQTIGRHPNDKMVSFYAVTPSGFEFEYGWGGLLVDDAAWTTTTYDHISEWGHRRPPYARPKKN